MQAMSARITGTGLKSLVPVLEQELGDYMKYRFGEVFVLYTQSYSLRVNSNLMISVILDFTDPDLCNIKIISGGGGQGLLGITWGSEGSRSSGIMRSLARICESNGWQLIEDD